MKLPALTLILWGKKWSLAIVDPISGSRGFHGLTNKAYLSIFYGAPPSEPVSALLEIDVHSGAYREIARFE